MIGNPLTDKVNDINSRVPFAHRSTLLSDELYEVIFIYVISVSYLIRRILPQKIVIISNFFQSTKASCNGDYVYVAPKNSQCVDDLQVVDEVNNKLKSLFSS